MQMQTILHRVHIVSVNSPHSWELFPQTTEFYYILSITEINTQNDHIIKIRGLSWPRILEILVNHFFFFLLYCCCLLDGQHILLGSLQRSKPMSLHQRKAKEQSKEEGPKVLFTGKPPVARIARIPYMRPHSVQGFQHFSVALSWAAQYKITHSKWSHTGSRRIYMTQSTREPNQQNKILSSCLASCQNVVDVSS